MTDLKTLAPVVARNPLLEQITSLQRFMTAAVGALVPNVSRLVGMVQGAQQAMRRWDEEAPELLKRSISGAGLIVPLSRISLPALVEVLNEYEGDGPDAAIRYVESIYERLFADGSLLDELEAEWASAPLTSRRHPILKQAIEAHRLGLFAVSVPALVAQFEGMLVDAVNHVGRMNGKGLEANLERALDNEDPLTRVTLTSFAKDALWAKFEHGSAPPPFSRHAILHGGDVAYGTQRNSRTALILIDETRELGRQVDEVLGAPV